MLVSGNLSYFNFTYEFDLKERSFNMDSFKSYIIFECVTYHTNKKKIPLCSFHIHNILYKKQNIDFHFF